MNIKTLIHFLTSCTDSLDDYTLQSTLTINHLTVNDEGDYHCTAKNVNGTSSSTFQLSVTGKKNYIHMYVI